MSGIRDNAKRGNVGDYIEEYSNESSDLRFVSAYFTIYAYEKLRDKLENIKGLKFLFGEPRFLSNIDHTKTQSRHFAVEDGKLSMKGNLRQKQIAKDCSDWIRNKVEIKSIKKVNFLHGKLYHFTDGRVKNAIMGSSNFTVNGLGLGENSNLELNLVVNDNRDLTDLESWFDELWNNKDLVEDVKDKVLEYLAQVYSEKSPQFIYYKTLYHLFEDFLNSDKEADDLLNTTLLDAEVYKGLYAFQKDAVKAAINKIQTYNGCIIADSVGLGKTYEALAIIKYYELKNNRVLVLCPKKLRENWTTFRSNTELNPFLNDQFRFDVLSHTDLSRSSGESGGISLDTMNWGNYDLVVIDESHNFRNNTKGKRDEAGEIIKKSRYEKLLHDIIEKGTRTKVLLLSATPVNNSLKDLRNQIQFIAASKDKAFSQTIGIKSIEQTIRLAQTQFTYWSKKKPSERTLDDLLDKLGVDFFKLLDALTIARSRKHIERYYKDEMKRLGKFPDRKTHSHFSDIDTKKLFMNYDKLSEEIDAYKLSLFNPTAFVKKDYLGNYQEKFDTNFNQETRESFLIGMMKVNFLKRLESSIHSFKLTMERTIDKIGKLVGKIEEFEKYKEQNQELDFDELFRLSTESKEEEELTEDEELARSFEVGKSLKFPLHHLDTKKWKEALIKDRQQLNGLYIQAKDIDPSRDQKLEDLKKILAQKFTKPTTNLDKKSNPKVIVFTAFSDTASYLYENLANWALSEHKIHSALIVGSGENQTNFRPKGLKNPTEFHSLLVNFSPIAKKRDKMTTQPQEGEIDLLIATDCISEGQNLQDCDYLINYDIHWNPVRIIQRFGRIDRLGSRNNEIYLMNFWPTENLDSYIMLKRRVETRMALVDIAATFEDNILKDEDTNLEEMVEEGLKYRDEQLKRLKDEILDLEDLNEANVSLTDFNLEDFRIDLLNYIEKNKNLLRDAPPGIYSVVGTRTDLPSIRPGVIFCYRKELQPGEEKNHQNPTDPYYLLYMLEDGEVRLSFGNAKQILTIFKELASEQESALPNLVKIMDKKTKGFKDMSLYENLIQKSMKAIGKTQEKKIGSGISSNRGFKIPLSNSGDSRTDQYDLITWLVIVDPKES